MSTLYGLSSSPTTADAKVEIIYNLQHPHGVIVVTMKLCRADIDSIKDIDESAIIAETFVDARAVVSIDKALYVDIVLVMNNMSVKTKRSVGIQTTDGLVIIPSTKKPVIMLETYEVRKERHRLKANAVRKKETQHRREQQLESQRLNMES
jgi:hypothetical protein